MTNISSLIFMAADSAGTAINQASLAAGGKDIVGMRASEAVSAGIFPLEVAFMVIGCLIVSGFVLLARESRIEKQADF